jgi:DNA-binding HxlR family transcriptional regulator
VIGGETEPVRNYGQYCPIARASEVLAERWTPIILRNLLNGASTFNEIAADAPGIPRSLLTTRLRGLERMGIIEIAPNPNGQGSVYRPTEAGRDLQGLLVTMGRWADRWLELGDEHVDPGLLLRAWCRHSLALDRLPRRRVVVRFEFPGQPRTSSQLWFIFDGDRSEICRTNPGFQEDLVVTAQARALTEWHLGRVGWTSALRSGHIRVTGSRSLARALPTWNLDNR